MSLGFRVPGTGDRNIDALLFGVRWKATELTFSFPQDASGYSQEYETGNLSEFGAVSVDLADTIRVMLDSQFAAVSGLTFRELAPGEDSLLSFATLASEPTARGTPPRYFPDEVAGNTWFNAAAYVSVQRGSYAAFTVLHEIGHSLGLKHGHDPGVPTAGYGVSVPPMTSDRNGLEFSIMTYSAAPGADIDAPFDLPLGHYPVSLMMYDIAALQYLYGADYETRAGDTVYRFNPLTGEMSIDGVGQGAPAANVVLLTIWDGGGEDTYDFSSYGDDLEIDLAPGAWSTLPEAQRAQLTAATKAVGNVFNALLYQDDPRSLIENAIGGEGDDTIFGNDADNRLQGGGGINVLDGRGGFDTAVVGDLLTAIDYGFLGRHLAIGRSDEGGDLTIRVEAFAFLDGTVIRGDGQALVDDLYYNTQYHDVWRAGVDADQHYAETGWREGRDPNALFSTGGYLGLNADIAAAGIDPLQHYHEHGWKEWRDPSAGFDTSYYLRRYADIAAGGIDPLEHYLAFGQAEGRLIAPVVGTLTAVGFDAEYYLLVNADIRTAGIDAWTHYREAGWREGRNPNAYFDVQKYLAENPDIAAGGIDPLEHYHEHGWREGREASDAFDGNAYRAAYADIAAGQIDPMMHFMQYGRDEGRLAFADMVA